MSERKEEKYHQDVDDQDSDQRGHVSQSAEDRVEEASSKVIEKGRARLIVSSAEQGSPEATESAEPKGIRPQPRVGISAKSQAPVVEDPVHVVTRLERRVDPGKERIKLGKAKFEKLKNRPSEDERQEEQWGQARASGWLMLLAGGGVIIVLVIGLVMMRGLLAGDTAKDEDMTIRPIADEKKDPFAGSPEKWFHERSGDISAQSLLVLKGFMDASDDLERSKWVRYPKLYLKLAPQWQVPINPLLSNNDQQNWGVNHTGETGYLILDARNRDFLPFRAYFTRDGETLKLDWRATTAWSDVSLMDIRSAGQKRGGASNQTQREAGVVASSQLSPSTKSILPAEIYTKSVVLRCMVRKREEFYAGPYNDKEHSAYMLLSADKMHHMWGYALKGSDLDLKLRSLLDHGSFVVTLKKDKRVTLRVRVNEKDALPSQLELVELLNPEWLTP